MRLRVYIDTSVVGGYFDEEFEDDTRLFFDRILNKEFLVPTIEIRSPKDLLRYENND